MVAVFLPSQLIPVSVCGENLFLGPSFVECHRTRCSLLFCLPVPETEVVISEVICQSGLEFGTLRLAKWNCQGFIPMDGRLHKSGWGKPNSGSILPRTKAMGQIPGLSIFTPAGGCIFPLRNSMQPWEFSWTHGFYLMNRWQLSSRGPLYSAIWYNFPGLSSLPNNHSHLYHLTAWLLQLLYMGLYMGLSLKITQVPQLVQYFVV